MSEVAQSEVQSRIIAERWDVTYRHSAGETASHFFDVLQNEGRLVGRRCPKCARVLVPPRAFCERCYVETSEWVDLGSAGRLETFTVVYQAFQGLPDPPYCFGYVIPEGASTAIVNYIRGLDLGSGREVLRSLRVGARVRTVFASERHGRMSDFWFELADR